MFLVSVRHTGAFILSFLLVSLAFGKMALAEKTQYPLTLHSLRIPRGNIMVSLAGAIGFVGLVIPHAVRFMTRPAGIGH